MKPFVFYWDKFSFSAGLKFIAGIIILLMVSEYIEFPWFVVGISALLAWIIDMMGSGRNRIVILLGYFLIGSILTWFSNILGETYWPWLIFLFIVSLVGTILLRYGSHFFMLGWSIIYWFLLMPTLYSMGSHNELLLSHVLGSGVVLTLVITETVWNKIRSKGAYNTNEENKTELVPWGAALPYALVVAIIIVISLLLGDILLSADRTMIANATFMIIGFSMINTWKAGLERMLAALMAVVLGFYLGVFIQSEPFGLYFFLTMSFLVAAFLKVNNGAVVFFFIVPMSYGWGLLEFERGNEIANERILAEFAGIVLAGVAITLLHFITRSYQKLMN